MGRKRYCVTLRTLIVITSLKFWPLKSPAWEYEINSKDKGNGFQEMLLYYIDLSKLGQKTLLQTSCTQYLIDYCL